MSHILCFISLLHQVALVDTRKNPSSVSCSRIPLGTFPFSRMALRPAPTICTATSLRASMGMMTSANLLVGKTNPWHGPDRAEVLIQNVIQFATAFFNVTDQTSGKANVVVGIHEQADVHQSAQGLMVENENPLDNDQRRGLTCVVSEVRVLVLNE